MIDFVCTCTECKHEFRYRYNPDGDIKNPLYTSHDIACPECGTHHVLSIWRATTKRELTAYCTDGSSPYAPFNSHCKVLHR
jgi:DNA-directed RNA polymerase subunit RPC12/RpoP